MGFRLYGLGFRGLGLGFKVDGFGVRGLGLGGEESPCLRVLIVRTVLAISRLQCFLF